MAVRAPLALLAGLLLVSFADEWTTYWPFGAIEPIRADLGLSYAEIGVAVGSLTAGGLLGHFLRMAADFVDRRWLSSAGALGVAAGMLTFGLGHSLAVLCIGGFVWGAASDAFLIGGEVALVDLCPEELPAALARVNALGSLGDLLAPLTLAGALALGFSWRSVFVLGAVFMLVYALLLASQRFPARQAEPPEPPLTAVWSVLRDPRVILLAAIDGLHALLDEPLLGFWNAFLERVHGWTPATATALISLCVAAGLAGYLAVPLIRRRLRDRQAMPIFAAGVAVSLAAAVFVPLGWVEAPAAAIFGFSGSVFYALLESAYLSLRPGQAGTTSAVVSALSFATIGFPALAGALSDAHGLLAGMVLYAGVPALIVPLTILQARTASGRGALDELKDAVG